MTMTDNTLLGDISKATLAMREDEKQHFSALVGVQSPVQQQRSMRLN